VHRNTSGELQELTAAPPVAKVEVPYNIRANSKYLMGNLGISNGHVITRLENYKTRTDAIKNFASF
jgi:hypothetical protein